MNSVGRYYLLEYRFSMSHQYSKIFVLNTAFFGNPIYLY